MVIQSPRLPFVNETSSFGPFTTLILASTGFSWLVEAFFVCFADDLGALHKYSLQFAKNLSSDKLFILSARHGLLDPDREIKPYDITLNRMSTEEIRSWSANVVVQLSERADLCADHFVILAGDRYRRFIVPHIQSYEIPLQGLRIGQQLQFLKKAVRRHENL